MSTFTPIVTLAGQAKIAASIAGGSAIVISQLAVGDANGATIVPLETMPALTHEVDRVSVSGAVRDGADPTKVIVTAVLPVNNGPYTIREIAIFTDDGQMFAIGAYPETFKPTPAQGVAVEVDVQFIIQVSDTANVVIGIDPANLFGIDKMLRVPFIAIDQHLLNTPPGSPAIGGLYTVGTSPTGAWIGQTNKLAQWNGSLYLIADAPERTVVGDKASGAYYRRTASGWLSFDPDTSNQGLARLATTAQVTAGAEAVAVVTPALAAQQAQSGTWLYAADTGIAGAYVVTMTPPPPALTDGMQLNVRTSNSNPGPSTLKLNAFAAKSILLWNGDALAGGELFGDFTVRYHAGSDTFRLITASASRSTWRRWYDVTIGVGGIASIDLTLPAWAEMHRISSRIAGVAGSQQSLWARFSVDGASFLAGASDYYDYSYGTNTNGNQFTSALPLGCTVDGNVLLTGWNTATMFVGDAAHRSQVHVDYSGINGAGGAGADNHTDFGKGAGFFQTTGKVLKLRLLGGGYLATGPTGSNIPAGTRIVIEGLTNP